MGTPRDNVSAVAACAPMAFAGTNVSLADALPSLLCGQQHDSARAVTIAKSQDGRRGENPSGFRDSMNAASAP
jgi:hypothetical protein